MFYLKIKAMKRLVLSSLIVVAVGLMIFVGCEDPEPIIPNEEQQQHHRREDSLINQQGDTTIAPNVDTSILPPDNIRPVEHWRAVDSGYYNYHDGTFHQDEIYTYAYMDLYPQDSILRAINVDSNDYQVLGGFASGLYYPYTMNGDTITIDYQTPGEAELEVYQRRWLVFHINDTVMYWRYLGATIGFMNHNYKFYLIGVEQ